MKRLMDSNIYEASGKVLISGSCLPNMEKEQFDCFSNNYDNVFFLCLEETHINMAVSKIIGMISNGKVTQLDFVSVNKSPHCIQLHYSKGEINRVFNNVLMNNYVIEKGKVYHISDDTLSLSKNLVKLNEKEV